MRSFFNELFCIFYQFLFQIRIFFEHILSVFVVHSCFFFNIIPLIFNFKPIVLFCSLYFNEMFFFRLQFYLFFFRFNQIQNRIFGLMNFKIAGNSMSQMRDALSKQHYIVHVWRNQCIFSRFKAPEITSFQQNIFEGSLSIYFKLLL